MLASCRTCFREVGPEGVRIEGGQRKPVEHVQVAAWDALQTGTAVGVCVCGQPLIGEGPRIPWTLSTPEGDIQVGESFIGPQGALQASEVTALLQKHYRRTILSDVDLKETATLLMLTPMIAPFMLWLGAGTVVLLILWSFIQPPGFR